MEKRTINHYEIIKDDGTTFEIREMRHPNAMKRIVAQFVVGIISSVVAFYFIGQEIGFLFWGIAGLCFLAASFSFYTKFFSPLHFWINKDKEEMGIQYGNRKPKLFEFHSIGKIVLVEGDVETSSFGTTVGLGTIELVQHGEKQRPLLALAGSGFKHTHGDDGKRFLDMIRPYFPAEIEFKQTYEFVPDT